VPPGQHPNGIPCQPHATPSRPLLYFLRYKGASFHPEGRIIFACSPEKFSIGRSSPLAGFTHLPKEPDDLVDKPGDNVIWLVLVR